MLEPDIISKRSAHQSVRPLRASPDDRTIAHSQKSRADAIKHYQAKVDFVRTNLETLQDAIQKKQDNLNMLLHVMQSKMQQQQQHDKP
jgi:hypothetical protein